MVTVAENMVSTLQESGITRVYGIAGDSLNGFTDALRTSRVEWINVRHEETAAFAAAAEAGLTGELAVCAGSAGPGNLHLINGLFDAQRSRVPVLAIAAHIPSDEIGSGYFQETHPQDLFRECSVYAEHVSNTDQMPRVLRIAMRQALEKRGVAVLVLSGDIALAEVSDNRVDAVTATASVTVPVQREIIRAAELLNAGNKVTILAGAGVAGAHEQLCAIAEVLKAPVVHALRGKEHIDYDNQYNVGMTGLLGFASGARAMEGCDTLLMLGTDFPYQQFFPDATTIQIDIRGEQLGKRTHLDHAMVGGVKETIDALLPHIHPKSDRAHLDGMLDHYDKTRRKLDELATPSNDSRPIHPQYLARLVDEAAADDAIFIPDVGSPVIWAARYLTMNGRRRLIGSFTHGSMASGLMHGIGAQVSYPGRQVIALAGDGGLTMMLGELLTLVQYDLPVKLVVFNNSSLNFIELEMKAAGFLPWGTGLDNPDFAAVARAMGIHAVRVEKSSELRSGLDEVLAHDGPALIDVVTQRHELAMPPSLTAAQVKGFALYAFRTVMSGRGDELVDLARTNFRQIL
ncbi:MAG: ubiquinone-dependent pyruvate dehydrogenase [Microbacteriaceae bacterium]